MKGLAGDFYTTGMEHSPTSTTGFRVGADAVACGPGAARDALRRSPE
jgi:hypothetical protein